VSKSYCRTVSCPIRAVPPLRRSRGAEVSAAGRFLPGRTMAKKGAETDGGMVTTIDGVPRRFEANHVERSAARMSGRGRRRPRDQRAGGSDFLSSCSTRSASWALAPMREFTAASCARMVV